MSRFSRFIAKKYLYQKGRLRAVHIISIITVATIAVIVTSSLVVLSVFNGYERILLKGSALFDPELLLTRQDEKTFSFEKVSTLLQKQDCKTTSTPLLYSEGMLVYGNKFVAIRLVGIDDTYRNVCPIDTIDLGSFSVEGSKAIIGAGSWMVLGTPFKENLDLLIPTRHKKINPLVPHSALKKTSVFIDGVVSSNSEQYNNTLFLSISTLRQLLDINDDNCHAIGLSINMKNSTNSKSALDDLLKELKVTEKDAPYQVLSQIEQQPGITHLVAIEKWLSYCILAFIMFLATFNVVCSCSLLILEKKKDLKLFHALGASISEKRNLFFQYSISLTAIGIISGVIVGLALCAIQSYTHFATFAVGAQREPYPIAINPIDIAAIVGMMLLLGVIAAWLPTYILIKKEKKAPL